MRLNRRQRQFRTMLETIDKVMRQANHGRPRTGYHYQSIYDFLLQHGKFFPCQPWKSREWQKMPNRMCFGNSIYKGTEHGWKYAEGLCLSDPPWAPVHHAFNVDDKGKVIDTTWRNTGLVYFGVIFSVGRADDASWNGDSCVLDDWHRGWPIFKEPWQGEDFSKVWPESPAMKLAKELNRRREGGLPEDDLWQGFYELRAETAERKDA